MAQGTIVKVAGPLIMATGMGSRFGVCACTTWCASARADWWAR